MEQNSDTTVAQEGSCSRGFLKDYSLKMISKDDMEGVGCKGDLIKRVIDLCAGEVFVFVSEGIVPKDERYCVVRVPVDIGLDNWMVMKGYAVYVKSKSESK